MFHCYLTTRVHHVIIGYSVVHAGGTTVEHTLITSQVNYIVGPLVGAASIADLDEKYHYTTDLLSLENLGRTNYEKDPMPLPQAPPIKGFLPLEEWDPFLWNGGRDKA